MEYLDDDTTDEELVLGEEDDTNDDFVNRQRTVELSISVSVNIQYDVRRHPYLCLCVPRQLII